MEDIMTARRTQLEERLTDLSNQLRELEFRPGPHDDQWRQEQWEGRLRIHHEKKGVLEELQAIDPSFRPADVAREIARCGEEIARWGDRLGEPWKSIYK
jgi:hypothetical protein